MLYKVTPMMPPPASKEAKTTREPGQPRKRRKSAVYDADGHEVLISLMCIKCRTLKPLAQFGLRKMADGAIRNQPWCRTCRSGAGTKKPKGEVAAEASVTPATEESTAALQVIAAEAAIPEPVMAEAPAAGAPNLQVVPAPAAAAAEEPLAVASQG